MDLNALLTEIVNKNPGLSDIHFKVGRSPLLRINGALSESTYGKANKEGSGLEMMRSMKENSIRADKAKEMSPEELEGKFVIGEFVDTDHPDYGSSLRENIRLRGGNQDE